MNNSIPIRLSDSDRNELEQKFNLRRPMLTHVASEIQSELQELLTDEGFRVRVSKAVLSAKQFAQLIEAYPSNHPLVECDTQIEVRVVSQQGHDLDSIRELIETHYQSVQAGWQEEEQQLTLKFVVPPQAKPDGYRERDDVPNLIQLTIAASESVRRMTTDGNPIPNLALIMKGGGIKGLAYVGAMDLLRDQYEFNWYVGTSAGAITAVLLAAGYNVEQLQAILEEKNFKDFFDAPLYKQPFNLIFHQGLHPAKEFTDWMDNLLATKLGKRSRVTLGDIEKATGNRITIYASQQRKKVLTFDSTDDPDVDAAYAARCSMSIPLIFTPEKKQGILAFDGGLQNNFPIRQLIDDHGEVAFISLYLGADTFEPIKEQSVLLRVLDIWMTQGEDEYVDEYIEQTVIVDPRPIGTLAFDINKSEKEYLITCGRIGAIKHIWPTEEHKSLPELEEQIKAKAKLQDAVDNKSIWRWRKSRIKWLFLGGVLPATVLYFLASWWFTGKVFWW